ncbi:MAG: YebC/PmpR family DNA-binding transcriptional regulator [Bacteroidia bacterium]
MSGHSKWSKIKRKKGANDARQSKVFSKMVKEIQVAVKQGGPDPEGNPRLRLAVQNAKGVNMPKDNIDRAINKASGADDATYHEVTYEGYAAAGVAVYVECTTDNINRTVANVRSYFNKFHGSFSTSGSLDFIFDSKGVFSFPIEEHDEDELMLELIDAGAEDVEVEDGEVTVYCAREDFGSMQKKLEALQIEPSEAGLKRLPKVHKKVDPENFRKVMRLIEVLEDDDDVKEVYHNVEMSDELMAAYEDQD